MKNSTKILAKAATVILFLCGIVISLKNLREPDVWWQLKTGEWMVQNFAVTYSDMFSYTHAGVEWINVKWLTEIIMYCFSVIGGAEFTPVLQAIVTPLVLWFMLKNSRLLLDRFQLSGTNNTHWVALLVGLLALVVMEFRINGRPEMVSHLMTGIFLFILLRYRYAPAKNIFWLVPLQMLWANTHEAYGTGMVMMVAFTIATWLDYYLLQKTKQSLEAPKWLTYATLGAIAAISINPNGPKMIWHPFNILGQVYDNKFTTELIGFQHPRYWAMESYACIAILLLIVAFVGYYTFSGEKKGKKPWLKAVQKIGLGYLGLVVAFFYLSLTAFRNIPFFVIVAAPGLTLAITYAIKQRKLDTEKLAPILYGTVAALGLLLYVSITTNLYYNTFNECNRYGLEVDALKNPIGVSDFMLANGIKGQGFTDYLTSAYLLWKQYPDYKTFIDLRDLDIFPADFMNEYVYLNNVPQSFRESDPPYDYIVLYRPQHKNLHQYLINFSNYKLVYADAVAALYLKPGGANDKVIAAHPYDKTADEIFQYTAEVKASGPAYAISKIFWPFYSPKTNSTDEQDLAAAQYYSAIANPNIAAARAGKVIDKGLLKGRGHESLGSIYYVAGINNPDPNLQQQILATAIENFRLALKAEPKMAAASVGMGNCYVFLNNYKAAEKAYKEALQHDSHMLSAYLGLGELYKKLEQTNPAKAQEYIAQSVEMYAMAARLEPNNDVFYLQAGLGYCALNDCNGTNKYLDKIAAPELLPESDRTTIQQCLNKCR